MGTRMHLIMVPPKSCSSLHMRTAWPHGIQDLDRDAAMKVGSGQRLAHGEAQL